MNKADVSIKEILDALNQVRKHYVEALECKLTGWDFLSLIMHYNIYKGFCEKFKDFSNSTIIAELKKDATWLKRSASYWYPDALTTYAINNSNVDIVKTECLRSRLDNINRTTARLEKELNQNQLSNG